MRVIDLSLTLENGATSPGDPFPPPQIETITSLEVEGWIGHRFNLTSLSGTYLEASAHVFPDGEWLDDIPLERCIRPVTIFHLTGISARQGIRITDLETTGLQPKPGDAVLIHTGWEAYACQADYIIDSPFFEEETMRWLIERGTAVLGADLPSFDSPDRPMQVVKLLLAANCLLLAPLINLHQVTDVRPLLVALPLKIKRVVGAPCRAIIIQN